MLAIVAGMCVLGRWQWDVAASKRGSLQNTLYAFQWWAMALIVIYGWWRLLHDDAHGKPAPKATASVSTRAAGADAGDEWAALTFGSGSAATTHAGATPDADDGTYDEELVQYNEYLAWLATRAEKTR
jgi:lysylphosphatidylglycerol synthetase-like protein (DUF2156 family)